MSEKEIARAKRKTKEEILEREKREELTKEVEEIIKLIKSTEAAPRVSIIRLAEKEFIKNFKIRLKKISESASYPSLINEEWFRIRPHEKFIKHWYSKWADILLVYARKKCKFLLSFTDLLNEFPFKDKEGRGLALEDLIQLVKTLENRGIAILLDNNHFLVFWMTPREISHMIYDEAFKVGLNLLRVSVIARIFPDIPNKYLMKMLDLLVKEGKASWIERGVALRLHF
ncbi:MAG: hypothetical protein ACTSUJ_03190 [Candidatus Njordarchaeales archaeon]